MSNLYYGGGQCSIEGSEIRSVQLGHSGSVEITKTTSDSFQIAANNRMIIIFPIGEGFLTDLFTYRGYLKILSILALDKNGNEVPTTINPIMNYSELMDSTSESMTTNSESMNAGYDHGPKILKTVVKDNIIKNQHSDGKLYLEDGSPYVGLYHVHVRDSHAMTGAEHSEESKDLFIQKTKGKKIVKTGTPIRTSTPTRTGRGGY